jgi:hypothetical protein
MAASDLVLLGFVGLALVFFILNERGAFGLRQTSVSALLGLAGLIGLSIYQYPPERPFQLAGIILLSLMAGMTLGPVLRTTSTISQDKK